MTGPDVLIHLMAIIIGLIRVRQGGDLTDITLTLKVEINLTKIRKHYNIELH